MSGALYLIPTTLGESGVEEVLPASTRRQIAALHYFIAENAKSARAFLKAAAHPTPIAQLRIETISADTPQPDIERLLQPLVEGSDAGLISEAGAPAVADPGALLVRRAHQLGIAVRPMIGPSSLLLALMASGMNGQHFAFHGYLPVEDAPLAQRIKELERQSRTEGATQLFIETPYRNDRLLRALLAHCAPSTLLCVATDLSLANEEVHTRSIADWCKAAAEIGKRPSVFLLLAS